MKNSTHPITRRSFVKYSTVVALAAPVLASLSVSSAKAEKPGDKPLRVAVVTGGHVFDVLNFHKLFRTLTGVDAYIQHMDDFVATPEAVRDEYAVVVFYHMLMQGPPEGRLKKALSHLGATEQGILVLHHALLAHPEWALWSDVVGIPNRKFGFHHDQSIPVQVARRDHPITRGLEPWTTQDETYTMDDANEGSEILLTTDHPKSMKKLAWTRGYNKSRVFCFQCGHDNAGWSHPNFREVLHRGIRWCARQL
jgi:uncharacterized protein